MYSRRSHRNSHHGCRECKERRVKCDETQPRCLRCKSKGRKCTYTHLLSQYNPFDPHQNQATTPSLTSPQQQPLICRANRISAPGGGNSNTVSFWDMSLLDEGGEIFHHYVHVVTITDPTHRVSEGFWRWDKAVQAFAPSHDFLYYAVLTFASLHRSELYQRCINNKSNSNAAAAASARQQRDHLVALASAYQSRAIASFTPAVTEMQRAQKRNKGLAVRKDEVGSQNNASATDAVLTCSSLILAAAFAFPPAPGQDMIDRARQVIHLFLGTFALYERAWEEDDDDGENRGPSPSPSPTTSSFAAGTSDIGAYVRDRVRAGEELGDGLPAPEAEASLERVVDAVLLRAATTNTSSPSSSSSSNSYSCSTFLAMLNPTLLYQPPLSPQSSPSSPPPPDNLPPSSPLPTFLPPIQALRLLFRRLQARPALHTIALRWPAHLPRSFLAALERRPSSGGGVGGGEHGGRRDPLALVVLAHWARCLAGFTHLWWISQWGAKVVRAVAAEVLGNGEVGGGGGLGGEASSSGVVEGEEEAGWAEMTMAATGSGSVGRERSGGGAGGSGGIRVVAEAEAAGETGGGAVAAAAAAEANAWRACLEWPVRGLGDAEAACWYR